MKQEELKKKLKDVMKQRNGEITNIISCLEVLENSLYFAEERLNKDITKAAALATEVIIKFVEDLQIDIEEDFTNVINCLD